MPKFWTKEYGPNEYHYRKAFISAVSKLLADGMRDDSHAFDIELLPKAKKLLLHIAPKVRSMIIDEKLSIGSAINSAKYHYFSAIVNYSLRYGRTFKKEEQVRWEEDIKEYFIEGLDKAIEPSLHYSIALGKYFGNLRYLDKKWVDENVNKIFPKKLESYWIAAFIGYLSIGKLYQDVYLLLKKNNHYKKALNTTFEREHDNKLLVQHICLGYINDQDGLDDASSMMSQLLADINANKFQEIVHYFHTMDPVKEKNLSDKTFSLWERLYQTLQSTKELSEYESGILHLFLWIDLIDRINDKIVRWVKFSIDHIKKSWDIIRIPECLLRHVEKTPSEVGEIYVGLAE